MNLSPLLRVRRWLGWALLVLAALALLWTLAAWWPLPALIRSQLESRGSQALGRELRVGTVEIAPWRLALTLSDLQLAAAAPGAPPQLAVARLHFNISLRSLWRLAPVIEALEVDAPRLRLARTAEGRYDIDDLLARFTAPAATPGEPARFALFNLQLRDGELAFDDRPVQRQHQVRGLRIVLPFLSNLPDDLTVKVEPELAMVLDDTRVELRGESLPFASDRTTELKLDLGDTDLSRWWAYLPAGLPLQPSGGRLDARLVLRFAQPPKAVPQLALSGDLRLRDLTLANAAGQPMLAWQQLSLTLAELRPFDQLLSLQALRVDGARLDVRRGAGGQIDWMQLAPPPPAQAASAPAPAQPWTVHMQRLELTASQLRWHDASTQPAAALGLQAIELRLDHVLWPSEEATALQLSAELLANGRPAGRIDLQGEVSSVAAQLSATLDKLPLAATQPYLQQALKVRIEGQATLKARLAWRGGEAPQLALTEGALAVDRLRITEPETRDAAITLAALRVEAVEADLLARRINIGRLQLQQPDLRLRRDAAGVLNVAAWTVAAPASAPASPGAAPWQAELRDLAIDGGQLQLDDLQVGSGAPHRSRARGVKLSAQNLRWPADASPLRFQLAAAVAPPAADDGTPPDGRDGRLDVRGQLTLEPLTVSSTLQIERLPLHAFEPYWAAAAPIRLVRAELGWRGELQAAQGPAGWNLNARGAGQVADLRLRSRVTSDAAPDQRGDEALLNWQSLAVDGVRVAMAPPAKPRIEIGELRLSDFRSRLVVTEQGRFNLRDVQGPAPAASAPPAAAAPASAPGSGLPVDLVVARTLLSNGNIDFRDRFVRPSYAAALTDLNGSIGRIASGTRDMAPIELRGRVAGTGLLEIRGAVNPTVEPLALDLSARASDLELAPLTPYSGKYIGYAIERGKLSVDVAYRIDADGKLDARNQLVLNQLTLGEAIESAEATKLPVRLALALLTDRHGVIDLDLPISGSVNDPQFSVFGIVLKIIGNLLAKALTAPFSLLAGGGGEELSVIEFVPGTVQIAGSGGTVIERVAKALAERPALRLTVKGSADGTAEGEAMRAAQLESRLVQEQRREAARAGAPPALAASAPAPSPEQRQRLLERLYAAATLPDKPRNVLGLVKAIPAAEMEARLKAAITLGPDSARELALRRSVVVRDALIARGLPSERLFLGAPEHNAGPTEGGAGPRARLSLASP